MTTEKSASKSSKKQPFTAFMWLADLSANVHRVQVTLACYVPYNKYPEFTTGLNQARAEIFGDNADPYKTGKFDLPKTGVVYAVTVDGYTGSIISNVPLLPEEAVIEMEKAVALNEQRRAAQQQNHTVVETTEKEKFGTPLRAVLTQRSPSDEETLIDNMADDIAANQ